MVEEAESRELQEAGKPQPCEVVLPLNGISIEDVEKEFIRQALERYDGNQTKAARCLRMTRDTLRYRMKKFGLGEPV